MAHRLEGKIALVMGAGSIGPGWGTGNATAVAYAREGATVLCADINRSAADETVALICGEGGKAVPFRCDATQSDEVLAAVALATEIGGRLDILHNNIGTEIMGSVVDLPETDWDKTFDVNLKTAFLAMKHAIPVMARGGGGSIINISSTTSLLHVGVEYAGYYASKAALNHLTRTTAVSCAPHRIRVNAILPGMLKTPHVEKNAGLTQAFGTTGAPTPEEIAAMWVRRDARVPLGRMGDGWDIARAAVFLASDEASYITGIDLVVDGGMCLRMA